jgi:bifunctional non-homologous end joining protein LigD
VARYQRRERDAGHRPYSKIDVHGAVVFRAACNMGLEGIVAKRRGSRYRSGRCREWIKIKNPSAPGDSSGRC